jgi:hypothetical protein
VFHGGFSIGRATAATVLAAIVLASGPLPRPTPAAAAAAEMNDYQFSASFSDVQGHGQWYYRQWDGASYTDMTWDAANNWWRGNCQYCDWYYLEHDGARYAELVWDSRRLRWNGSAEYVIVGPTVQHPDVGRESVRAWSAPRDGTVRVTAAGNGIQAATGREADGVGVRILRNSDAVWPASGYQTIPPGGRVPFEVMDVAVRKGDRLYFHVAHNSTTAYDTVTWVPIIQYA